MSSSVKSPSSTSLGVVNNWEGCLLKEEMLRFEADLIKRALEAANGHITPAARLLGLSHQTLAAILQGRHKDLLSARSPVRKRRRSIIRTSSRKRF
jgi:DNA-binding NtrC family response regulator